MAAEQRLSPFLPRSSRGGRSADRRWCGTRHPWPASRSGRSPDRQGSPANDAGRRASRRSTAAFREIEIPLQLRAGLPGSASFSFWPSRQSRSSRWSRSGRQEAEMAPVQRAPRRAAVVPPGTMPGAARVQACEACPQGPPLAPSAERLRKTPLSERGGRVVSQFEFLAVLEHPCPTRSAYSRLREPIWPICSICLCITRFTCRISWGRRANFAS